VLEVRQLSAGYGAADVVHELSFEVARGSFCALIGANGAGKSTIMKALSGLLRPVHGQVRFEGEAIERLGAAQIVRRGLALVPEGRRVFAPLTVRENLQMGAFTRLFPRARGQVGERLDFVLATFPRLRERLAQAAGTLSGGEQQMLAVSRALMSRPRLLLLDEPSFGLAPLVVQDIFRIMRGINADEGVSVLLVEQNASLALELADRAYVLETGQVVISGSAAEVRSNESVRRAYLGF
jgi:branched-chain amino acid transport system ATP-binding protein